VRFTDSQEEVVYDNVNHYIPEKLFVFLGHDMPSDTFYSGKIAYSRVNLGSGAYVKDNKFDLD
jgi:hypothetical protein